MEGGRPEKLVVGGEVWWWLESGEEELWKGTGADRAGVRLERGGGV